MSALGGKCEAPPAWGGGCELDCLTTKWSRSAQGSKPAACTKAMATGTCVSEAPWSYAPNVKLRSQSVSVPLTAESVERAEVSLLEARKSFLGRGQTFGRNVVNGWIPDISRGVLRHALAESRRTAYLGRHAKAVSALKPSFVDDRALCNHAFCRSHARCRCRLLCCSANANRIRATSTEPARPVANDLTPWPKRCCRARWQGSSAHLR